MTDQFKLNQELELNNKTKQVLNIVPYAQQMDKMMGENIRQCERDSPFKGHNEVQLYKSNQLQHEKVIEAIRAANYAEMQNVNIKYKRLLGDIIQMIAEQLGELFKREFMKIWHEMRDLKMAVYDRDVKLRNNELVIQEQEQNNLVLRNQISYCNNMATQKKLLEDQVAKYQQDNKKLRDENKSLQDIYNQMKRAYEDLELKYNQLKQLAEEQKRALEKRLNEVDNEVRQLQKDNAELNTLINQLQIQLDKYKELYEKELKSNEKLQERLNYWKSTHQQRLNDLQNTEVRVDSQKGYLFKYRREVEDLKRFKVQGQDAQKIIVQQKQQMYLINQKSMQIRQTCDSLVQQQRLKQDARTENINDILLQYAQPRTANTSVDLYYDSPKKNTQPRFDFPSASGNVSTKNQSNKKLLNPEQQMQEELQSYLVTHAKTPFPLQGRRRFGSASTKRAASQVDYNKISAIIEGIEQVSPFNDQIINKQSKPRIRRMHTQQ